MTFSEQIVYGWFKPSKYKDMIELPRRRFVVYVIVMMLVLAIVSYVVPTASIISGFGGFEKLFTQSLGEVNYTDDTLSVSNNFDMHINAANFLVDTSQETVQNESLKKQGMFLAVGSKTVRISMVLGSKVTDYGVYYLSDYLQDGFNNDSLVAMIPSIYAVLFVTLLGTMLSYFVKYAVVALLFSILVNSMNHQFLWTVVCNDPVEFQSGNRSFANAACIDRWNFRDCSYDYRECCAYEKRAGIVAEKDFSL